MQNVILIVHILAAICIIALVLLQHGKGADAGAGFGSGASGTVFGSQGSTPFLMKMTAFLALIFFVTSLTLAYRAAHTGRGQAINKVDAILGSAAGSPVLIQGPKIKMQSGSKAKTKVSATKKSKTAPSPQKSSAATKTARSGGIGRHAVLRGQWRKVVPVRVRPSAPIFCAAFHTWLFMPC